MRHDGRANPNQLVLDERHASTTSPRSAACSRRGTGRRHSQLTDDLVVGLQLTHSGSGRARDGHAAALSLPPSVLDDRVRRGRRRRAQRRRARRARRDCSSTRGVLAPQAGFDFVDVKHCHGYLLHELLGGVRPARAATAATSPAARASSGRSSRASAPRAPAWRSACGSRLFDCRPVRGRTPTASASPVAEDRRTATRSAATAPGSGVDLTEPTRCSTSLRASASGSCARPPAARTTTRTSSGRRSSRRPTATRRPRTRSSASPGMIAATAELTRAPSRASRSSAPATRTCRTGCRTSRSTWSRTGGATSIGLGRGMLSYPRPARRRARRPAAADRAVCPDLQRLHHRAAQRPRLRLLPARPLLQGTTRTRRGRGDQTRERSKDPAVSAASATLRPGLCSITLRQLPIGDAIGTSVRAGWKESNGVPTSMSRSAMPTRPRKPAPAVMTPASRSCRTAPTSACSASRPTPRREV